jgi:hypothetical protein
LSENYIGEGDTREGICDEMQNAVAELQIENRRRKQKTPTCTMRDLERA